MISRVIPVAGDSGVYVPCRQSVVSFGSGAIAVAALCALYLFDPAEYRLFPPCPFHAITGFHCPGCGSLRALHALLRGHLVEAFDFNPLMILFLPILAYMFLSERRESFPNRNARRAFYVLWHGWAVLALIVGYGILRNLPFYPFVLLAP
ncbi:MAG: DUF2752 domain-containing protein [Candidatus Hydrogenedentes bacterium]|nr:DUF2752 domain-containing protein [Candidatus Hydrogenedentota bacterium]